MSSTLAPAVRDVSRALLDHDYRTVEVEIRLGKKRDGAFVPGIARSQFETLERALGDPTTEGETIERTRGESRHVSSRAGPLCVIHKKRLSNSDVSMRNHDARVSVSLEINEPTSSGPGFAVTHVRTKTRKSYVRGTWRIDLTRVLTEPGGETTYEVEVELADPRTFFGLEIDKVLETGMSIAHDLSQKILS